MKIKWKRLMKLIIIFIIANTIITSSVGVNVVEHKTEEINIVEHKTEEINIVPLVSDYKQETSLVIIDEGTNYDYYIEEIPLSSGIQEHLYETCLEYDVDYFEALAVMSVENPLYNTDLKHKNKNGSVDYGLFQINTINHEWLSNKLGITDFLDPYQSIEAGIFMLSNLSKTLEGHYKIMAYNMGVSGMKKYVSKGETSTTYSEKVMNSYEDFIRRYGNES